jgi:hypothetical protein
MPFSKVPPLDGGGIEGGGDDRIAAKRRFSSTTVNAVHEQFITNPLRQNFRSEIKSPPQRGLIARAFGDISFSQL